MSTSISTNESGRTDKPARKLRASSRDDVIDFHIKRVGPALLLFVFCSWLLIQFVNMAFLFSSAVTLLALISPSLSQSTSCAPTVTLKNGSYTGFRSTSYGQDFFLGIPYAQPPLGALRLSNPVPLNTTFSEVRNATAYYPLCVGYGGDDVGYPTAEDCLALNVIRPSGYEGQNLPVAVWIHGGGFVMGGTQDRRYNLSFIVNNAATIGKPIIGVSVGYRLSAFGFLDSDEIRAEGVTNLGMKDQRLALQWIQENIAAFGGDPTKVTIWGESAGAGSVGIHVIAFGGRDDGLFRGAISESGTPILLGPANYNVTLGNAIYANITAAAGCSNATDTLACLRAADFNKLNAAVNVTPSYSFLPYIDGDMIQGSTYTQLTTGKFIKVPYLIGTNTDEGSAFSPQGINTDAEFQQYLESVYPLPNSTLDTIKALYPDIPALGVLDTFDGIPDTTYGNQFKRSAALAGDNTFIAARRLVCQSWAAYNASAYAYRFNVIVNPNPPLIGVTHFQEVAFVFNNVNGLGYAVNPFENEPATFYSTSKLMSNMWASFVYEGNPNGHGVVGVPEWPVYNNGDSAYSGYGRGFVFDVNVTSGGFVEADTFRGEGIAYLNTLWPSIGK